MYKKTEGCRDTSSLLWYRKLKNFFVYPKSFRGKKGSTIKFMCTWLMYKLMESWVDISYFEFISEGKRNEIPIVSPVDEVFNSLFDSCGWEHGYHNIWMLNLLAASISKLGLYLGSCCSCLLAMILTTAIQQRKS